jgi:hypothetical protein
VKYIGVVLTVLEAFLIGRYGFAIVAFFIARLAEEKRRVGYVFLVLRNCLLIVFKLLFALLERILQVRDCFRVIALIEGGHARLVGIGCLCAPCADGCVYILCT